MQEPPSIPTLASVGISKKLSSRAQSLAAIPAAARIAKDKQLEIDASEIRMRAERRLGEMLVEQKQGEGLNKGTRSQLKGDVPVGGTVKEPPTDDTPTLADIGISAGDCGDP
jgi:hypothetical protein